MKTWVTFEQYIPATSLLQSMEDMLRLHNDISVMERKDDDSEALASRGKFGKPQDMACCHFYSTSSRSHDMPDDGWMMIWKVKNGAPEWLVMASFSLANDGLSFIPII